VDAEKETIWLTQAEMAELFGVDRARITRHLSNIYKGGELDKSATCAESAQVQKEGTRTVVRHLNNILRDEEIDLESNVRKTHFANADRPTALYGLEGSNLCKNCTGSNRSR
jgi:hypothetical protein